MYNPKEIKDLLDGIAQNPENAERLLEIATESAKSNRAVVKATIHYEYLGDSDKCESLRGLLLELERLEHENPYLRWKQNVPSTLAPSIDSWHMKKKKLTEQQKAMHDCRAVAARELLDKIADDRPLKVARPLIAIFRRTHQRKFVTALLHKMYRKNIGGVDPDTMKGLVRLVSAAIKSEVSGKYATMFLRKVIDEGENDLIYFVGPLIGIMQDTIGEGIARELLDAMGGKRLGKGDPETLKKLAAIGSAAVEDKTRGEYTKIFLKKIIDEGENDLIYFVGPLICVRGDRCPASRGIAKELLDALGGKKLGKGDPETVENIQKIFKQAIHNPQQRKYVLLFVEKLREEGVKININKAYEEPRWKKRKKPKKLRRKRNMRKQRFL